ncbi:MAG: tripartite tricarboxylate transporter substrate binding protein [Pigmentiphaga sp.]
MVKKGHHSLIAAAVLGSLFASAAVANDNYPSKPVRIVVPLAPGGSNDVLARMLAADVSAEFKETVFVENRPGASGNIGTDHVAKADGDGYTLGIAPNQTVSVNPALYNNLPFDVQKELRGVTLLATLPQILVVSPKVKANTIEELVDYAKKNPGKLTFASAGAGSPQHMSASIFQNLTGTEMIHVPYKGSSPAMVDVLAGNVDIMFCPANTSLPHVTSKRLRALGITGDERHKQIPDVPTIAERVKGFEGDIWIGIVAPKSTPDPIVEKLNGAFIRSMNNPSNQQKLAELGITTRTSTPAEFDRLMAEETQMWARVIKQNQIKVD